MSDSPRFTTRDLPIAAKLVLTVFLLAVGLGYFSALVQLHLQHSSRRGDHLPSPADVVEIFSGLKPYSEGDVPQSKIEAIISGPRDTAWGKSNMTPAFFTKSNGFEKDCIERGKEIVENEREGERLAVIAWINTELIARKKTYDEDAFPLPEILKDQPITEDFYDKETKTIFIADLIGRRCARCHNEGGQEPPLETFDQLIPHITAPDMEIIHGKFGEEWVRSGKQVSIEGLTQSTHAHLLSFSVLFTLTGLITALSRLPAWYRLIASPIVLIAQVADISCWWLARTGEYGPYFAQAIILTGSVVGLGLICQIVFGILSMFGTKGKAVLLLTFLLGLVVVGTVYFQAIRPALQKQKDELERAKQKVVEAVEEAEPNDNAKVEPPKDPPAATKPTPEVAAVPVSLLEKLIMGPIKPSDDAPWNGKGSMGAAFFARDGDDYKDLIEERPKAEVDAEREGERLALQAWLHADLAARKAAYDADKFALPPDLVGKPITSRYLTEDKKAVTVTTLLEDRCVRCHAEDGDVFEFPLQTYEQLMKYVSPPKVAAGQSD